MSFVDQRYGQTEKKKYFHGHSSEIRMPLKWEIKLFSPNCQINSTLAI